MHIQAYILDFGRMCQDRAVEMKKKCEACFTCLAPSACWPGGGGDHEVPEARPECPKDDQQHCGEGAFEDVSWKILVRWWLRRRLWLPAKMQRCPS